MVEALSQLALVVAALFTGAAIYVNAVEHPARRQLDPSAALQEWQPAYRRGAAMQATLALVGLALAATAAFLGAGKLVALGAAFIIAPWPWTYLAIMPLNKRLLAMPVDQAGPDVHSILDRWNALHRVRTLLGAAATVCLLWASLRL
jgi:Anthrone oxygenase